MIQDRAIFTIIADQQKVVHGLANGAIFNDLERPQIQILRSLHYLMLTISETVKDTATVANNMSIKPYRYPNFRMVYHFE